MAIDQEMMPMTPEEMKPDPGPDTVPDNGDYQHLVDYCIDL